MCPDRIPACTASYCFALFPLRQNSRRAGHDKIHPDDKHIARLTLCAMRPEDFNRFAEIWRNPCVVRHIGGKPKSRGEAWDSFLRNAGHWQMAGFGQWACDAAIESADDRSGRFLLWRTGSGRGFRPLSPRQAGFWPPRRRERDWDTRPPQAAHDWFDRVIPGPLVAMVNATMKRRRNLAQKLGYVLMRECEYMDTPVHVAYGEMDHQHASETQYLVAMPQNRAWFAETV